MTRFDHRTVQRKHTMGSRSRPTSASGGTGEKKKKKGRMSHVNQSINPKGEGERFSCLQREARKPKLIYSTTLTWYCRVSATV